MKEAKIVIRGGKCLSGEVRVSGAKNAALPVLAATCLSSRPFRLQRIPQVEDVRVMLDALQALGAEVRRSDAQLDIRLEKLHSATVATETVRTTRASVLLLGPLLARNGFARVSHPGGCAIGERKINFHLEGLERMGAEISGDGDYIVARCERLRGVEYRFPAKSVTGTENLLMAAVLAEGTTVLDNCALEPEVTDLVDLLRAMGADIRSPDGVCYEIDGRPSLAGAEHRIIPDRIETGTYVIAGCLPGNDITVHGGDARHIASLLQLLQAMGASCRVAGDTIRAAADGELRAADVVTRPYPGFPTDLQAQLTTLMTQSRGVSHVRETIFNDRFKHCGELRKLGADIDVSGDTALIRGPAGLRGATIATTDLRASAALVLGGLSARGETRIENAYQLFRGYEDICPKLQALGADIRVALEE